MNSRQRKNPQAMTRSLNSLRQHWAVLCIIPVLLLLAYHNRFIQDDAFISFRYAYNLAHGDGLTWNPGERVEGYTNYLWTLLMAVPLRFGWDVVGFSQGLGLLCALGTLVSTYALSLLLLGSSLYADLVLILLGTNYTFSAYATGGLETQLQTFLLTAIVYLALSAATNGRWTAPGTGLLSVLCALSLMTRPDSVVFLAVLLPFLLWRLGKQDLDARQKRSRVVLLLLPALLLTGSWLAWKWRYYGDVLPNTFYLKVLAPTSLRVGARYVYQFFGSYCLLPFPLIAVLYGKELLSRRGMGVLLAILELWCVYMARIGGDFMEFRLLVPVLPLLFVLLARLVLVIGQRKLGIALVCTVLVGSLGHAQTFSYATGIESIEQLDAHITHPEENWRGIGEVLGRLFRQDGSDVIIATTAAGALPYASRLTTVDMLGLNDRWIARHGPIVSTRPGHQKRATHQYLAERGVNLVLGHPQLEPIGQVSRTAYSMSDLSRRFGIARVQPRLMPDSAAVLEIPLDARSKISVLYLTPNRHVDRVIEERNFRTYPVLR